MRKVWIGRRTRRAARRLLEAAAGGAPAALVFAITLGVMAGCHNPTKIYYSADPITARVVDADTKQPLAGVNILAEWTYGGGEWGDTRTHAMMVLEAVSDDNGTFSLPAWGPKLRRFSGLIRSSAPLLILFKSGYKSQGWANGDVMNPAPYHMRSDSNGKVLELRKFEGSMDEYAQELGSYPGIQLTSLLDTDTDECNWKAIPKFIAALDRQNRVFVASKTRFVLSSLRYLSDSYSKECGSLEKYVKEFGQ